MSMDNNKYNKEVFAAMEGIEFTAEEQSQYDSWTKEQIYEAYLLECNKAENLRRQVIRYEARIAKIRKAARELGDLI